MVTKAKLQGAGTIQIRFQLTVLNSSMKINYYRIIYPGAGEYSE